jgi:sodium-type polar flagellar protein MotX
MKIIIQFLCALSLMLFSVVSVGEDFDEQQNADAEAMFEEEANNDELTDAMASNSNSDTLNYKDVDNMSDELNKQYSNLEDEIPLVHVYTVDEINAWVESGTHLKNVAANQCQFSQDIQQRAKKNVASSYDFLYAEMLISGVCFGKDVQSGIYYMNKASQKGYPAAMAKLAFYYEIGRYVFQDEDRAVSLMHEAAMTGFVQARIDWVGMLLRGLGSPSDYEEAYGWLHNSVPSTLVQFNTSDRYLKKLSAKMPTYAVRRAKTQNYY